MFDWRVKAIHNIIDTKTQLITLRNNKKMVKGTHFVLRMLDLEPLGSPNLGTGARKQEGGRFYKQDVNLTFYLAQIHFWVHWGKPFYLQTIEGKTFTILQQTSLKRLNVFFLWTLWSKENSQAYLFFINFQTSHNPIFVNSKVNCSTLATVQKRT